MRRLRWIGSSAVLAVLLAGCGDAPDWGPSWNSSSRPTMPNDGVTVRRIMGEDPEVEALTTEAGRWALREPPRATLANPEQALEGVPRYNPMPRPDVDRALPPPRVGSSSPSALPGIEPIPEAPPARAPRVRSAPPLPRVEGSVVPLPGGSQGVVTGGTAGYRTYQEPGRAGGGIIIPQADGTGTVIGPDGRTITVPMPR